MEYDMMDTVDYSNTTEITELYSNLTVFLNEYSNVTEDTNTRNNRCQFKPSKLITTTIEKFDKAFGPLIVLYDVVPAELALVLLIVGMLGNVLNVFVYTRPGMRTPMNRLLAVLELVNLFVLFAYIQPLIHHYNRKWNFTFSAVILLLIDVVVREAALFSSNWLTVLVGIWRYIAINWPLRVVRWCGWNRTKNAIVIIAILSSFISIPYAFFFTYERLPFNLTRNSNTSREYSELRDVYLIRETALYCFNPLLGRYLDVVYFLTTLIPCICFAIVTFLLLRSLWIANIKRQILIGTELRQPSELTSPVDTPDTTKEKRLTILLTLLVFLYFFAYLPDVVVKFLIRTSQDPASLFKNTAYAIFKTRIIVLVCNSSTFFLYYAMSEKFRETLWKCLLPSRVNVLTNANPNI